MSTRDDLQIRPASVEFVRAVPVVSAVRGDKVARPNTCALSALSALSYLWLPLAAWVWL